jgi:hypothetical protein
VSAENFEIVRRVVEAWNRNDLPGFVSEVSISVTSSQRGAGLRVTQSRYGDGGAGRAKRERRDYAAP